MHSIRHHPASVGTQIRQFGRGATGHRSEQDAAHSGGYLRRRPKTEVALRDRLPCQPRPDCRLVG
jgi:hypothetical protein